MIIYSSNSHSNSHNVAITPPIQHVPPAVSNIERYLPSLVSLVYGLTVRIRRSVLHRRVIKELMDQHRNIAVDNTLRGKRERRSEHMVKNWDHIDVCYPVDGRNAAKNQKIRMLIKAFLNYESSGAVRTSPDDIYNHKGRMKFIRFLKHQRHGDSRDMRFTSTLKRFL